METHSLFVDILLINNLFMVGHSSRAQRVVLKEWKTLKTNYAIHWIVIYLRVGDILARVKRQETTTFVDRYQENNIITI